MTTFEEVTKRNFYCQVHSMSGDKSIAVITAQAQSLSVASHLHYKLNDDDDDDDDCIGIKKMVPVKFTPLTF